MQIIECEQGSIKWRQVRIGIPTASQFKRILTPTGKLSASATDYMYELIAESLIGQPYNSMSSQFMERGNELEQEAIDYYEFATDQIVDRVGFCVRDDGLAGCSPDGLVGQDGGLEIKCPGAKNHVGYLLNDQLFYPDYKVQVQGSLYVTGRDWWDLLSYNPVMPNRICRVQRDEGYIGKLEQALGEFNDKLNELKEKVNAMERIEIPIEGWPFD